MKVNNLIVNGYDIDYPIEEYRNGLKWYRIWKSGFKECGDGVDLTSKNYATITLPITFSDTNWNITWLEIGKGGTVEWPNTDTEGWNFGLMASTKTKNSFNVSVANDNRGISYIARGW